MESLRRQFVSEISTEVRAEVRAVVSLNDVELLTAFLSGIDKTSSST